MPLDSKKKKFHRRGTRRENNYLIYVTAEQQTKKYQFSLCQFISGKTK